MIEKARLEGPPTLLSSRSAHGKTKSTLIVKHLSMKHQVGWHFYIVDWLEVDTSRDKILKLIERL